MESCSQNHFKIFFKLLIFFMVLLDTAELYRTPRARTNPAQGLPLCCLFAFGTCHRRDTQSRKWNHYVGALPAVFSSCSVCIMYVCMYYYYCQEGLMARQGWRLGTNLREGKRFKLCFSKLFFRFHCQPFECTELCDSNGLSWGTLGYF